ncbi:hypothetical protein BDB01DRAFT_726189 [Pilobolus umbonatus]|nr:hypothetical protein BDB01DRAFT_726189 [Pilobolus umbonatus]
MKGRDDTTKPTLKKSSTLYEISGPSFKNLQNLEYLNKQVYTHVHAQSKEWEVVSNSEALPYLPNRQNLVDITVGIQKQQEIETPLFGSIKLDDYLKYGKGYILNTGGSIWGLDFAPKVPALDSDPTMDYLAVAGYKGTVDECIPMTHVQEKGSYRNCIQIWKLHLSVQKHSVAPVLDLCLLHDYGVIYDLKWCPYGCYDEVGGTH